MTSEVKPQTVFIIGAARSGTKFLRSCLSVSSDVAAILTILVLYGDMEMNTKLMIVLYKKI